MYTSKIADAIKALIEAAEWIENGDARRICVKAILNLGDACDRDMLYEDGIRFCESCECVLITPRERCNREVFLAPICESCYEAALFEEETRKDLRNVK